MEAAVKKVMLALLISFLPVPLFAQAPAFSQITEMKKLAFLVGKWKGSGYIEFVPGQRRTFRETESVQSKLGGLLLLIEGTGKGKTPGSQEDVTVHDALAVVVYDDQAKAFRWTAYQAARGFVQSIDTHANVGDETVEWGFQDPRSGSFRFTITLDKKKQWTEIGEISHDGQHWQKFFAMTLQRSN